MKPPKHIRHFTAANPGYMTLQGTNQYLLGREEITVIDVALPTAGNVYGILKVTRTLKSCCKGSDGDQESRSIHVKSFSAHIVLFHSFDYFSLSVPRPTSH